MTSDDGAPLVAVYGASGMAGGAICRALARSGNPKAALRLVGRDRGRLEEVAASLPACEGVRVAGAEDRVALAAAFVGCKVVVNAVGPSAPLGDEVVQSAIACGSHYLDVCAEQAVLRRVVERCDAAARHGHVAVVPGAGFSAALGDLLAAAATAQLLGHKDDGPTVRQAPGPRLSSAEPIDVAIGYLFDDLTLSPGAQSSVFANLHAPMVAWRRDRWDAERPGRRQRTFHAGPAPGEALPSSRQAFSLGGGDNLTIPRHVAAHAVDTYVSVSRSPGVHRALRLAALAASWLPPQASSLLVPSRVEAQDYAATRFTVIASAQHPLEGKQAVAFGRDLYATSAELTARLALALARRQAGGAAPVGVLAPAEIVRAPAFLAELERDGVLTLE